jgi:hypothetical protein
MMKKGKKMVIGLTFMKNSKSKINCILVIMKLHLRGNIKMESKSESGPLNAINNNCTLVN